ncbi:MAG: Asp-tRNA(Asn)/Glu-tRNA(Gln) amidotransferase subunit GatC [Patescibacteria group bacterium]|jgi:aspartyl-tRNA(Asn)/glutamyl-tRNA(Gln) amidotransferase subunit C
MQLSEQDIEHLAKLARLNLDKTTEQKFAEQLSRVIDYVEVINNEQITDEEKKEFGGLSPIEFRTDKPGESDIKNLEKLPPKKEGKYIVSPPLT